MFTSEESPGCEAVVRFNGVFDARSAREVSPLFRVKPPRKVTLDFSQATDVDNYGLSALVADIVASHSAVRLCGLRMNQIRMLQYCGLDPGRFGIAPANA